MTTGARKGFRFGLWAGTVFAVAAVLTCGWIWLTLNWSYSDGERAGILQKFSRKGWICKTYEGEIAQYVVGGVGPQIWTFSVRDDDLAAELYKQVGQNVRIHYNEHRGVPTKCFGDTPYYAVSYSLTTPPTLMSTPAQPANNEPPPSKQVQ